ncbi:MAG: TorF family putative porin [Methylophilaceae bacterium]
MRQSLLLAAVLGTFALPVTVLAADAAPAEAAATPAAPAAEAKSDHTFTYNIGLYSQYVFRGLTQTQENVAVQGGADYSHSSGFYAGTWASNVSWLGDTGNYDGASIEWDIYGGYRNTILDTGIGYDVGLLQYVYPGINRRNPAAIDPFTSEVYAALSYRWITGKVSVVANNNAFAIGNARGSWYAEGNANVPIDDFGFTKDTGVTLNFHVGHQEFEGSDASGVANSKYSYTDWKLGATKSWSNGINVGFYYTDTDAIKANWQDLSGKFLGAEQFVGFIQKTF